MKILVVDDDPQLRKLVKEMFAELKISDIECASDGREGLTMLKQADYDMVLLDLHMPPPNGIEFMVQMGKMNSGMPCVLVTAAVDEMVDAAMNLAREAGVNMLGALHKPFTMDQLHSMVDKSHQVA